MLRLAIQKSGRLSDDSLQLINSCGISYPTMKNRLKTTAFNFPIEILYLRDDDIPKYVAEGVADVGIVGENVFIEAAEPVEVAMRLGFAKCRLCIAVPRDFEYNDLNDLNGMTIATSYPRILSRFLEENHLRCQISQISGSVEIAPSIGLAGAIFDIVSSGGTLLSNGLKEIVQVAKSEAILVSTPHLAPEKAAILDKLLFRISSVQRAKKYKYILLNTPNDRIAAICAVLPGMKSPTVVPLAIEGWSSLHTVIKEDDFWDIIDKVREAGGEGIIVAPIEKLIF